MNITSLARTTVLAGIMFAGTARTVAAQDKNQLQKCDKPIGTLAVVEPQQQYMAYLQRYQLGSPASLLRMMAQQSNCFVVVERGVAMQNMQQERSLARSGEMQQDANMGGGQMKAADFILTPAVTIDNPNAGGVGAVVGGLLGRSRLGAVAGGLKFKEAQTSILVSDARTTVQIAAAEGKAKKTDFSLGAIGYGGGVLAGGGGYTSTAEGKVIAASYLDNYNNIVRSLKGNPELMARAGRFKGAGLSGDETSAGPVFNEGDVVVPKIDNVKLLSDSKNAARVVASLKKGTELVFLGQEAEGYLKVQAADGEGWVKKTLVSKR